MATEHKVYSLGFLGRLVIEREYTVYTTNFAEIRSLDGVKYNLEILPEVAPVLIRFFNNDPMNVVLFCATFAFL